METVVFWAEASAARARRESVIAIMMIDEQDEVDGGSYTQAEMLRLY